jgi:hypothetical protein
MSIFYGRIIVLLILFLGLLGFFRCQDLLLVLGSG